MQQDNSWQPRLAMLSWDEFAAIPASNRVVVLPVGAIEQHGYHLPLCTDAMNVEAVALDAARNERVLVAPTLDYGVSPNHMSFPGTISLTQRTLVRVLVDIGDSLVSHGVPGMLLLNGNGGNAESMRFACAELRTRLQTVQIGFSDIGDFRPSVEPRSGIIYHADEVETSHALHVNPEAVKLTKAVNEMSPAFLEHYRRYYSPSGELHGVVSYGLPATGGMSSSGVMGDATLATRDLGAKWHSALVQEVGLAVADLKRSVSTPAI